MVPLTVHWHQSFKEIPEHHWKILLGSQINPFYEWKWLNALETSGSICSQSGWQPLHLAIWREDCPIAVAPLYLKVHSYGEFVFDQVFAGLAKELGLNYYPKLIGMSPLSPVEGYRFFYAPGEDIPQLTDLILNLIDQFASKNGILSCNFLYVDLQWSSLIKSTKYARWLNQKSLWTAGNSKNFSDYLARFNSNQRRNIKRERKSVKNAGIRVSTLTGAQINKELMDLMYLFYKEHCAKWGPWGSKYLAKEFFSELSSPELRDKLVIFNAYRENLKDPLAMSLCIQTNNMIWGRYWGAKEDIDYLHFELCYYSPIAWALDQGVKEFDPGAGGSHKRRRGFMAESTTSLHRWYDQRMDHLIRPWLKTVNKMMMEEIKATNDELPFKSEQPKLSL